MSKWRRTAIEELPCCKSIIEESDSPGALWDHLYEELTTAYGKQPRDEKTIQQIYRFALQYARSPDHVYLARDVDIFFQAVIGSSGAVGEDLGNRLSASDLARFESAFSYWFSEEEADAAKKNFHTSQHKGKRR